MVRKQDVEGAWREARSASKEIGDPNERFALYSSAQRLRRAIESEYLVPEWNGLAHDRPVSRRVRKAYEALADLLKAYV